MCAARSAKPTTGARSKDKVILNNKQVSDAALRWIEIQIRGGTTTSDPDMTVGDATRAYIAVRDPRRSSQAGRAIHLDAHNKLNRYARRQSGQGRRDQPGTRAAGGNGTAWVADIVDRCDILRSQTAREISQIHRTNRLPSLV
jgi:hypothetical protein